MTFILEPKQTVCCFTTFVFVNKGSYKGAYTGINSQVYRGNHDRFVNVVKQTSLEGVRDIWNLLGTQWS